MCRIDECDPAAFSTHVVRKAIKRHRCDECGRWIEPRERYEYSTGKSTEWDGIWSVKTCVHCQAARKWLSVICNGWIYTQVLEELIEHWEEEYQFRCVPLGKLIIRYKHRWQRDGQLISVGEVMSLTNLAVAYAQVQIADAERETYQRAFSHGWHRAVTGQTQPMTTYDRMQTKGLRAGYLAGKLSKMPAWA